MKKLLLILVVLLANPSYNWADTFWVSGDTLFVTGDSGVDNFTISGGKGELYVHDGTTEHGPYDAEDVAVTTYVGNDKILYDPEDTPQEEQPDFVVNSGSDSDEISTGAGDDTINAGSGNDTIYTGGGVDEIYGDAGDDTIMSGFGADKVYGGTGYDILWTGDGHDYIISSIAELHDNSGPN